MKVLVKVNFEKDMDFTKLKKSDIKELLEQDCYYDEEKDEEVDLTFRERLFLENLFEKIECDICEGTGLVEQESLSLGPDGIESDVYNVTCDICYYDIATGEVVY